VSTRCDRRELEQTIHGLRKGAWAGTDEREPGIYCGSCGQPVDAGEATQFVADDRVESVDREDFSAGDLKQEFLDARPDADWTSLRLPEQGAKFGNVDQPLNPHVAAALERTARSTFYSHQAQAIDLTLAGNHVVQATPTGSGKSIGFLVPVLQALVEDEAATALLMFPLRALANDQLTKLHDLGSDADAWLSQSRFTLQLSDDATPIDVARYDGATPTHERAPVRASSRLVISTPDMLHMSILRMATKRYADGTSWNRFLSGLRYVVLDEIHVYRGAFGSNVAQVLRRLRRAAAWHGSSPRFLAASATIGNPGALAERLTGVGPFSVVVDDGSPHSEREVIICNPPLMETPKRTPGVEAKRIAPQTIALELIANAALGSTSHPPVRTVCFARSRIEVFALTNRLRNRLTEIQRPDLTEAVRPYAATMLADDREHAEARLRDGSTLGIVSTSALELGIDIPELSLAVLCGYPGQTSSFRQRSGRVGRRGEGLVLVIVGDDPLQQYIAGTPHALESLLHGRPDDVVVNPDAQEVVRRFGLIAGQEDLGGIAFEDAAFFGKEHVDRWLTRAKGAPTVVRDGVAYWHLETEDEFPTNLRTAAGGDSYTVLATEKRNKRPIGTIDSGTASRDCFVDAIWPTETEAFRVIGFDTRTKEVYCEGPVVPGYLTRGVPVDTVAVGDPIRTSRQVNSASVGYSNLQITRTVFSYKKLHTSGQEESAQVGSPRWPSLDFDTEGLHLHLPDDWLTPLADPNGAIRALEHTLLGMAPAVVSCDAFDLDSQSDRSSIYLYDSFGAGLGLSRVVFERLEEVLGHARNAIAACRCDDGCPGCVVLSRRPDHNQGLSKEGALTLLEHLS
jgi:DEAD/DEAH box helicase domain-containing protein